MEKVVQPFLASAVGLIEQGEIGMARISELRAAVVNEFHPGEDCASFRMLLQESDLRLQLGWQKDIIGIQDRYVLPSGMLDAIVCGCGDSAVPVKVVEFDSGILKLFNPSDTAIRGTVIGYNDLKVLEGLIQDALYRFANMLFPVVAGNNNAKLRHEREFLDGRLPYPRSGAEMPRTSRVRRPWRTLD